MNDEAGRDALPPADWFSTARPYPTHARLHDLVADAAARHPGGSAVLDDDGVVYRHADLDLAARRTAAFLGARGARTGTFVGLLSTHHPEAVRSLLGVLHAGAAYVPLDPRWPLARLAQVLRQTDCGILLVASRWARTGYELADLVPSLRDILVIDGGGHALDSSLDPAAVEDLWDTVAGHDDPYRAAGFGTFDDAAHGGADAVAYREHVVALASDLVPSPGRVLEIGCGSGLILQELAPHVAAYSAVDPSGVAGDRVRKWAAETDAPVTVAQGFAHEIRQLVTGTFELILLSSTVQFFPGPEYLSKVLADCAALLAPGGHVLVADVVDPTSGDDPGLLRLPARFFGGLTDTFPSVAISTRDGLSLSPRLAARYDVVLGREPQPDHEPPQTPPVVWGAEAVAHHPPMDSDPGCTPDDLAYCIFTSGSTGQPKGVMVTHRSIVNLIDWVTHEFGVDHTDRLLFVTSFAFDLSVYDMFGVLAAGAAIRILDDESLADPDALIDVIVDENITFWDSAPAAMSYLLSAADARAADESLGRPALKRVFLSGDWVPTSLPARIRTHFPDAELIALGGATEATVWSNSYRVRAVDPSWPSIPYGKPMQNARYHVLDVDRRPCAIGVAGDLYIAGTCVAAGYLGDPDLTRARFTEDPDVPGDRRYQTGDRARWLADGNLQFLGRIDGQVKVRGYRIELGDVQAALLTHPGLTDAVVTARKEATDSSIAGFYVCRGSRIAPEALRDHLSGVLPNYMIPGALVPVTALPMTTNGKVDRDSLVALLDTRS